MYAADVLTTNLRIIISNPFYFPRLNHIYVCIAIVLYIYS